MPIPGDPKPAHEESPRPANDLAHARTRRREARQGAACPAYGTRDGTGTAGTEEQATGNGVRPFRMPEMARGGRFVSNSDRPAAHELPAHYRGRENLAILPGAGNCMMIIPARQGGPTRRFAGHCHPFPPCPISLTACSTDNPIGSADDRSGSAPTGHIAYQPLPPIGVFTISAGAVKDLRGNPPSPSRST
ncbi:hypothetical protein Skr01_01640 [Sphaerisporangium krabiense]|nr:hypothetical protein Skr01_01640 [Sphaerisporangium krabiense]